MKLLSLLEEIDERYGNLTEIVNEVMIEVGKV
jgi:hypothetical protein